MTVCRRIYDASREKAGAVGVEALSIGLGYTAVATTDGGLGLSYTASGPKTACSVLGPDEDYEGRPAALLLERLLSSDPLRRSLAASGETRMGAKAKAWRDGESAATSWVVSISTSVTTPDFGPRRC